MRLFIIPALIGSLVLAGCTTTIKDIDSYIRAQLPIACDSLEIAYAGFVTVHQVRPFGQKIFLSVEAAYTSGKSICSHPETVSTVEVITKLITTGLMIQGYIRQAESAGVE